MSGTIDGDAGVVPKKQKIEEPPVCCYLCGTDHEFEGQDADDAYDDYDEFGDELALRRLVEGCSCRGPAFRYFHVKCYADLCERKTDALVSGAAGQEGSCSTTPSMARSCVVPGCSASSARSRGHPEIWSRQPRCSRGPAATGTAASPPTMSATSWTRTSPLASSLGTLTR